MAFSPGTPIPPLNFNANDELNASFGKFEPTNNNGSWPFGNDFKGQAFAASVGGGGASLSVGAPIILGILGVGAFLLIKRK